MEHLIMTRCPRKARRLARRNHGTITNLSSKGHPWFQVSMPPLPDPPPNPELTAEKLAAMGLTGYQLGPTVRIDIPSWVGKE